MKSTTYLACTLLVLCSTALLAQTEIGYIEKFALAPDREKALTELVPGSEDYFFYHALQYQNTGQKDKLAAILKQWELSLPGSARKKIIENRSALLSYDTDPESTLAYLKRHLQLSFEDVQRVRDQKPDTPSTLDQARVARSVFEQRVLQHPYLEGITEEGLEILVRNKTSLQPSQRRSLLSKITRPDIPGLLPLVIEDLKSRESRGYGEYPIHKKLLPAQMAEVARQIPAARENAEFVNTSLRQLSPNPDVDINLDKQAHLDWLDRLWSYVSTLPPSYNSLKASVLNWRLQYDRSFGIYDKSRFIEYLKLPRNTDYANPKWAESITANNALVNFGAELPEAASVFRMHGDDAELVREFLLHILKDEPAWEPWAVWLRESWLKSIFAETKIIHGVGKPDQWTSLLSGQQYQALRDRVDVEFPSDNTFLSKPNDPVSISVLVKNAPKLIIKTYEINTLSYYLAKKKPLDITLNVDGLVANWEETKDLPSDNPFLRTRHTYDFPELKGKRGAWIIEFIGGGKSSRALIRKGQWSFVQNTGAAGDEITVLDEEKQPVPDAVAYFEGRRFEPNTKTGKIQIPFTNTSESKPLILASPSGAFASLSERKFFHHREDYKLSAQFHIEREQLLKGKEATLAMRSTLLANGQPVPIELLVDTNVILNVVSLDGISTSQVLPCKLNAKEVFSHTFTVPDRTATIQMTLSGKVEKLSDGGTKQDLSSTTVLGLNGMDRTDATYDTHLSRFNDDYIFELLGKNGEPVAEQQVEFVCHSRGFSEPIRIYLSTDAQGRTNLGRLRDLSRVEAIAPNGRRSHWPLFTNEHTETPQIHSLESETISIPWNGTSEELSLLETRNDANVREVREGVTIKDGFITIVNLPHGDYLLTARGPQAFETHISVTKGQSIAKWLVGESRELESNGPDPVQIVSVVQEPDAIAIQLANSNTFSRVHVAATRFLPVGTGIGAKSLFESFAPPSAGLTRLQIANSEWHQNIYSKVREIGDEYRYILERRYSRKLPGNMLTRPGLLLNPWELGPARDITEATGEFSESYSQSGGGSGKLNGSLFGTEVESRLQPDPNGSNIDFLAEPAPVHYNLSPDKDGIVRVPKAWLKDRQYLQIYAENLTSAAWQTIAFPEVPAKFRDLRLQKNLDPSKSFVEVRTISPLKAGESLKIDDISSAELETYQILSDVFRLLRTLNPDEKLAKFEWILNWPDLDEKQRARKYSEFACHELNFFLYQKDRPYFDKVIVPYLKNKKDKTFLDHYLLGDDLSGFLRPWQYAQLNLAEKCLLARRIPAEVTSASRYVREHWELKPPNPADDDRLFEAALRRGDLSAGNSRGEFKRNKEALALHASLPPPASAANPFDSPADIGSPAPRSAPKAEVAKDKADKLREEAEEMDAPAAQELRREVRPFYRKVGPTKIWAENNYYNLLISAQDAQLIPINKFWRDYAAWDGTTPFLSPNIAETSGNFTEMMLALALIDLPLKSEKPKTSADGHSFTLTTVTPMIAFHQQIKPSTISKEPGGLLVSQNFFESNNRYRTDGNQRYDRYVTDEFLVGTVYGANIVVTNPTSSPQKVELLLQIPQGSIPVSGSKVTNSPALNLQPYTTKTIEYYFYFPKAAADGKKFAHYPVQVSREEQTVGSATAFEFNAVAVLSKVDQTSWDYVSQNGTEDEVFAYLEKNNLQRIDVAQVAWRCRKSVEFFKKLVAFLDRHHLYNDAIYRYGLFHKDQPVITEWLQRQPRLTSELGSWFSSKLLTFDPVDRRLYEHLEFWPLINPRTLRYGALNRISNEMILRQYKQLLEILSYKPALAPMDHLSVAYYQFLQDRAAEALDRLKLVKADSAPTQLQLDCFRCYAAFYEGQPEEARKIASWHANHPVNRWKEKFMEVLAQADEIQGKAAARANDPDAGRNSQQEQLAASEPVFDFKSENQTLTLSWSNLKEITFNYYRIDPEFSFTASPFVTKDASHYSLIKPNQTVLQLLPDGESQLRIKLPGELANSNLLIEAVGAGMRKTQSYHANTLRVTLAENYGFVEVRDLATDKPIPTAYVKVYARLKNGEVRFYKDGYTDLRGKFDYASLNTALVSDPVPKNDFGSGDLDHYTLAPDEIDSVERLSILILSEHNGGVVREVNPPSE